MDAVELTRIPNFPSAGFEIYHFSNDYGYFLGQIRLLLNTLARSSNSSIKCMISTIHLATGGKLM